MAEISPLKRVLVATDFSEESGRAVRRVAALPLAESATAVLLHVVPPKLPAQTRREWEATARGNLERLGEALARRAHNFGRRLKVEVRIGVGKPYVEIIRAAREVEAELVVTGRQPHGPLSRFFGVPVSERIVRNGSRPVLVTRQETVRRYQRPMVALDLSDESRRALELLLRVLDPGVRTVHAVHVCESPEDLLLHVSGASPEKIRAHHRERVAEQKDAFLRFLAGVTHGGVRLEPHLTVGEPELQLVTYARSHRIDLLAFGAHGRGKNVHALVGSVAEGLTRHAPCDVLVGRSGAARKFRLP